MNAKRLNLLDILGMGSVPVNPMVVEVIEEKYLAAKEFDPIPQSEYEHLTRGFQELMNMKYEDLDTVFITVLYRGKDGELCPDCNVVHDDGGIKQMVFSMGDAVTLRAAVNSALRGTLNREGKNLFQDSEAPSSVSAPGPGTPQ